MKSYRVRIQLSSGDFAVHMVSAWDRESAAYAVTSAEEARLVYVLED
jgi:hypothetical protein